MSQFGVRVNGVPKWIGGTVSLNGVSIDTSKNITGWQVLSGQNVASGGIYPNGNGLSFIQSTADGSISFYDHTLSTFATAQLKSVNFVIPASTFASIATITNGPRAANPISWVEVFVAGSSGRVPVW